MTELPILSSWPPEEQRRRRMLAAKKSSAKVLETAAQEMAVHTAIVHFENIKFPLN